MMWMALLRKYWLPLLLAVAAAVAMVAAYNMGRDAGKAAIQKAWDKDIEQRTSAQVAASATVTDVQTGQQASTDYQKERASNEERIRVVRQTIVRTVTGPCLDDGVRQQINAAINPLQSASAAR